MSNEKAHPIHRAVLEIHLLRLPHLIVDRIVFHPSSRGSSVAVRSVGASSGGAFLELKDPFVGLALALLTVRARRIGSSDFELPAVSGKGAIKLIAHLKNTPQFLAELLGDELRPGGSSIQFAQSSIADCVFLSSEFVCNTDFVIVFDRNVLPQLAILNLENEIAALVEDSREVDGEMYLVPPRSNPLIQEIRHASYDVSPALLDVGSRQLEELLRSPDATDLCRTVSELATQERCFHLSQHVAIALRQGTNWWDIVFEFEIMNVSFVPVTTRTHQFWFGEIQSEVLFLVEDMEGQPIQFVVEKASSNYRKVTLDLPHALGPMGKFKYRIRFPLEGENTGKYSYSLTPRTITKKLSFSVTGYLGFHFSSPRVEVESNSGHMKDTTPDFTLTTKDGIETMSWVEQNPPLGDVYRTVWSEEIVRARPKSGTRKSSLKLSCIRGGSFPV